jgi:hypothetical protein
MNREYLYANWRGGNALLGRVAAMVKVGTTRVNLTSQWPHAFLSGIFFISEFKFFVQAVFTWHANPKYFLFHPSHRIFRRMHKALNVGKKNN